MEKKPKMDEPQLQHFDHEHPLMFKEEHVGPQVSCQACEDPVLGPCYSCDQCSNEYILHKSCAQLPREILRHPLHSQHASLELARLRGCSVRKLNQGDLCHSCKQCSDYFILHKSCARLAREIPRPVLPTRDSDQPLELPVIGFECNACFAISFGFTYICVECHITLDVRCAFNFRNIDDCIEHFSHSHPLSLVTENQSEKARPVFCTGCLEQVLGPRFICRVTYGRKGSCSSIVLHRSCAELPPEIKHPMHCQHSLTLTLNKAQECHCDVCDKDCSRRFTYTCFQCDFNLDLKCAAEKGLVHFSHNHPLMIKKQGDKRRESGLVLCDGCQDPLYGPIYTCINTDRRRNCRFNLHKSCAELPREIKHPVHRQHPLLLLNIQDIKVRCSCNACNQPCRYRYSCSLCDFNLHLKCATNWRNIIETHEHQFSVPRDQQHHLICDVCGEFQRGSVYYICSICQLLVDEECGLLPSNTKILGHQHSLKLTWFLEDIFPKDQVCKICSTNIEKCRAVYYCQECCAYAAHTRCMAVEYFQKEENIEDDDYESDDANEIKHFSHQHPLVFNDCPQEVEVPVEDEDEDDRLLVRVAFDPEDEDDRLLTCQGCIRPIAEAFYSCSKQEEESCHFYLHTTCAQFPEKMLLPLLQQYQFTLLSRAPSIEGVFQCSLCSLLHQGFVYSCDQPDDLFCLDLECSIYCENRDLKHESHVHRLLLDIEWDDVFCKGCGSKIFFCFSCKRCDFYICIACVKLPLSGRHRYDPHSLKLTYKNVEDETGEYYCQICEGERDPAHWYYWCQECQFDCHPHCLLGRYPRVMLGSTYKHDGHVQHLVTLISKWKSPIPGDKREIYKILPCNKCGELCQGLVFECRVCNINFHRDGCCGIRVPESSRRSPQIEELT